MSIFASFAVAVCLRVRSIRCSVYWLFARRPGTPFRHYRWSERSRFLEAVADVLLSKEHAASNWRLLDGEQVQAVAAVQEQVLLVVRTELDAKIGWVVAIASLTPLLKIRKMFGRNDPGVLFVKLLEHLPDAPPVPFVEVRNVLVLHVVSRVSFGGCRPVVTGVSLEAIGCPIGCPVVTPGVLQIY